MNTNGSRFSALKEELWRDRKFLSLTTDARLLFIWAWSPPHSTICGLYRTSWKQMKSGLGRCPDDKRLLDIRLQDALEELSAKDMLHYDPENEVLWVVNRVKHAAVSRRAAGLMVGEFRRAPESPLAEAFMERWGTQLGLVPASRA